MNRTLLLLSGLLLLASLAMGCSTHNVPAAKTPGVGIASTPYHQHTLQNLYLGRTYMAQGRYELARQRLLLAMSSATNGQMRATLARELDAVDLMIQTLR